MHAKQSCAHTRPPSSSFTQTTLARTTNDLDRDNSLRRVDTTAPHSSTISLVDKQSWRHKGSAKIAKINSTMSASKDGMRNNKYRAAHVIDFRRKTGITLADRGVYDEHGLEPISGIFSSPEKSPPKRGGTVTASEYMEIQESTRRQRIQCLANDVLTSFCVGSIPELTTSHQILRSSRTHFPPPRSRSPKKTALGSSPRRQSSMAPRGSSIGVSSPIRAASHPTARRLDFEHDESSLQETPALSGSGQRRGKRSNVYDIPEDESPAPGPSAVLEESFVQQEITAHEDSAIFNGIEEESSIANIGDDTTNGAEAAEDLVDLDQSEVISEPVKEPAKRGRKRKSDTLEQPSEPSAPKSRKPDPMPTQSAASQRRGKKAAPVQTASSQRPKRVSNVTEQESSVLEASMDGSAELAKDSKTASAQPKRRGRPPRAKPVEEADMPPPAKPTKSTTAKANTTREFVKPAKPTPKPKENPTATGKTKAKLTDQVPAQNNTESGKFVDVHGHPLSKKDIEEMSAVSVGSRYGRGRHLSVFRELEPEAIARIGRTGRHRVAPIDFWKNDRIAYDTKGNMTSIVKNQDTEPERRPTKSSSKGKKRSLSTVEEADVELEPWEEEGTLTANFKDYDSARDVTTDDIVTDGKSKHSS